MFVLALMAMGCAVTVRPTCEVTPEAVGDDDVLPDGTTAAERLAAHAGSYEVPAVWPDDTPVDVAVGLARGEGAAEWVRSETSSVRTYRPGLGTYYLQIHVICEDHLRVPVRLTVRTPDDVVDVDTPATAYLFDDDFNGDKASIYAEEAEIPGLPPFEEWFGDETTRDGDPLVPAGAAVHLEFDATRYVRVGWNGEAELDDGNFMAWSLDVLDRPRS